MLLRGQGAYRRGYKQTVVHSAATTAASVADAHRLPKLLHGDEKKVWGDAACQGQTDAIHEAAPEAQEYGQGQS
jgi:IS5 family transposase